MSQLIKPLFNSDKNSKSIVILMLLLLAGSAFLAYAVKSTGLTLGFVMMILMIALPIVYAIVAYPKFGVITLLVSAYFIMLIITMGVNFPLGTMMDGIQALLIIGFFISQKYHPNWTIFKNAITPFIILWICYNLIEFFNPIAESRLAWVYTIRSVAAVMLMYFIFCYHIKTVGFIRLIIKIWLSLSVFAALYAIKQEYIGFFGFEERGLFDSPLLQNLYFINGHWRKMSIFSDPVTFAYNMVISSLLCVGLIWGPTSNKQKIVLGGMTMLFLWVMLFSGTRGAYVLFPAALFLFAILNYNKRVMLFTAIAGFFIACLIFFPTGNQSLVRFQSAFRPSDDASFNVRKLNQKRIQPYIISHPIGGGLGATGIWGVRFAPYSLLAQFPPDSGYVRVAVELGWIGLFILCTLMFVILRTGIRYFYKIKDPELRCYCLAMVLIVFAINIGNYPQEALVQFPTNIYFYLVVALINITYRLDQEKQENGEPLLPKVIEKSKIRVH